MALEEVNEKTLSKCPLCGSKDLEQEFAHRHRTGPIVLGGETTSQPPILDGCHCNKCGTRSVFNKAGKCPACDGTGRYVYVTGSSAGLSSRSSGQCPVCFGKKRI